MNSKWLYTARPVIILFAIVVLLFTFQNCQKYSSNMVLSPQASITLPIPLPSCEGGVKIEGVCKPLPPLGCSENLPATCTKMAPTAPQEYQVLQRDSSNKALVKLSSTTSGQGSYLRFVAKTSRGAVTADVLVATTPGSTSALIGAELPAIEGWYEIIFQELSQDLVQVFSEGRIARVGVGEVFLTAGQSNSVASGEAAQANVDLVSGAFLTAAGLTWVKTIDPYPTMGTPWPIFANMLSNHLRVPVGIVQVGCGATQIKQWLPADKGAMQAQHCGADASVPGMLFVRLVKAADDLKFFRSILWHQGESDVVNGTSSEDYRSIFIAIMNQLNIDTRTTKPIPWFIANTSFYPGNETLDIETNCTLKNAPLQYAPQMLKVRAAQQSIWNDQLAYRGPDTDALIGPLFRYPDSTSGNCVHFSDLGLKVHGQLWYKSVSESKIIPGLALAPTQEQQPVYRYYSPTPDLYWTLKNIDLSAQGYTFSGTAFKTYRTSRGPDSVMLYACAHAGGAHFVSVSDKCEGQTTEFSLGYISQSAYTIGTTAIVRFYSAAPSAYFLTTAYIDEGLRLGLAFGGLQGFAPPQ